MSITRLYTGVSVPFFLNVLRFHLIVTSNLPKQQYYYINVLCLWTKDRNGLNETLMNISVDFCTALCDCHNL